MFPGDEDEPTTEGHEAEEAEEAPVAVEASAEPGDEDLSALMGDGDLSDLVAEDAPEEPAEGGGEEEEPAPAESEDVELGDQLSADELSALADAFSSPEEELRSSSDVRSDQEPVVLRYDLVGSTAGQRHDFPALDLIHQSFTLALGTKLERETRREGVFVSNQPEMMNFSEIYATLPMPTGVLVVEVSGLGCTGLLLIEPGLLVYLIDLLMGGQGRGTQSPELFANRNFTGTERLIIRRLVEFINISLAKAWREICPVSIRLVRAEVDPRHAAVFSPADRVCEFRVDIEWDDVVGDMRILLPMEALRPFEKRLALTTVTPKSSSDSGWRHEMKTALLDVPITLKANLGCAEMTVRQLLDMKEGDYLRLDREPDGRLDVFVEDQAIFEVEPTVQHGNVAVILADRITRPVVTTPHVESDEPAAQPAPAKEIPA